MEGVIYQWLPSGATVSIPQGLGAFRCLILLERPVDMQMRYAVSKLLVTNGCLYAMAWGDKCSLWDDSIDEENLEQFGYGEIPADKEVMTTWHAHDTLEDVMHFAKFNSTLSYNGSLLDNLLILDFSDTDRPAVINDLYVRAG